MCKQLQHLSSSMGEAADSVDPFADLTAEQQDALERFRDNLSKAGLYLPQDSDRPYPSHDDATLLRFLRARVFDPVAAQKQFAATEEWRKHHDVDNLYASISAEELYDSRRFYPRWTGRRDMNGVPLYVYHLASLKPIQKELDSIPAERRYQRMIALYENMIRFTLPFCSSLPHPTKAPVATTSIIDLQEMSLGSLWAFRNHLRDASKLATANYPETLHVIAVVNSPSFFPTVWGWIKGWFDEGTRNKIHVLGTDMGPTLLEFIHPSNLPKQYGGELEWSFSDDPILDEEARDVLNDGFPSGPVIFRDGKVLLATTS